MTQAEGTRVTLLGAAVLVAGGAFAWLSWWWAVPELALAGVFALASLAVDVTLTRTPGGIQARREVPADADEADEVPVRVHLQLSSILPRCAHVEDAVDPPAQRAVNDNSPSTPPRLRRRARIGWTLSPRSPGGHRLGPLKLVLHGPLGLLERTVTVARTQTTVRIHARSASTGEALPASERTVSLAREGQHPDGDDEFDRLRAYQPGDRRKDINWKASQRALARGPNADPVVTVRTEPSVRPLVVMLDARAVTGLGAPERTPFARGVRIAAGLLSSEHQAGRPVGLVSLCEGAHVVEPASGRGHRERLAGLLASQRPAGQTRLWDELSTLRNALPAGCRLAYVGPLVEDPRLPEALTRVGRLGFTVTVVPVPIDACGGEADLADLSDQHRRTRKAIDERAIEVLA